MFWTFWISLKLHIMSTLERWFWLKLLWNEMWIRPASRGMKAVGRGWLNGVCSSVLSLLSWTTCSLKLWSNEPTTHMAEQISHNSWLIWRNKIIISKNEIERTQYANLSTLISFKSIRIYHYSTLTFFTMFESFRFDE